MQISHSILRPPIFAYKLYRCLYFSLNQRQRKCIPGKKICSGTVIYYYLEYTHAPPCRAVTAKMMHAEVANRSREILLYTQGTQTKLYFQDNFSSSAGRRHGSSKVGLYSAAVAWMHASQSCMGIQEDRKSPLYVVSIKCENILGSL